MIALVTMWPGTPMKNRKRSNIQKTTSQCLESQHVIGEEYQLSQFSMSQFTGNGLKTKELECKICIWY